MSLLLLFQGPIDLPPAPPEVVYGVYADALLSLTGEGAHAMVAGEESARQLSGESAATSIEGEGAGASVGGSGGKTFVHQHPRNLAGVSAPIPRIEAGTTKNFSVAYSAAPIATGLFVYAGSGSTSLVHTASTISSDSTHFNAFVTVGDSAGMLLAYEWCASFAVGPVYHRGYCQIIKTRG